MIANNIWPVYWCLYFVCYIVAVAALYNMGMGPRSDDGLFEWVVFATAIAIATVAYPVLAPCVILGFAVRAVVRGAVRMSDAMDNWSDRRWRARKAEAEARAEGEARNG